MPRGKIHRVRRHVGLPVHRTGGDHVVVGTQVDQAGTGVGGRRGGERGQQGGASANGRTKRRSMTTSVAGCASGARRCARPYAGGYVKQRSCPPRCCHGPCCRTVRPPRAVPGPGHAGALRLRRTPGPQVAGRRRCSDASLGWAVGQTADEATLRRLSSESGAGRPIPSAQAPWSSTMRAPTACACTSTPKTASPRPAASGGLPMRRDHILTLSCPGHHRHRLPRHRAAVRCRLQHP